MGRPRKLTDEQAAEIKRRYLLWRQNTPKRIRSEFGIGEKALHAYVHDRHKDFVA